MTNRFSLSADGTRAVREFPHPDTGMLYTRTCQLDRKDYRTNVGVTPPGLKLRMDGTKGVMWNPRVSIVRG